MHSVVPFIFFDELKSTLLLQEKMAPYTGDATGMLAYRLGDCVKQYSQELNEYTLEHHPQSIAAAYVSRTTRPDDLVVLNSILDEKCKAVTHQPDVAVHVRTGDALCDGGSAVNRRPPLVDNICTAIDLCFC